MTTAEAIAIAIEAGRLRQLAFRHGGGAVGVQKAYREVAMTAHPDQGGDAIAFRHLTAARDSLLAQAGAIELALRTGGLEPFDEETQQ